MFSGCPSVHPILMTGMSQERFEGHKRSLEIKAELIRFGGDRSVLQNTFRP